MNEQRREELPLPDYDHLPVPALRDRIRSLTADELTRLRDYERAHANRAPVLTAMDARLDQLAEGATPTSGKHDIRPEQPEPTRHGSPANPAAAGEPVSPPPHGVPAQPADPKGDKRP